MSELEPYSENDPQWSDLPVPDGEASWQAMKAALDADEDDRKPLVPLWFRSCAPWAVLGGLSLVALLFFVRPDRWFKDEHVSGSNSLKSAPSTKRAVSSEPISSTGNTVSTATTLDTQTQATDRVIVNETEVPATVASPNDHTIQKQDKNGLPISKKVVVAHKYKRKPINDVAKGKATMILVNPGTEEKNSKVDTVVSTNSVANVIVNPSTTTGSAITTKSDADTAATPSVNEADTTAITNPTAVDSASAANKQVSKRRFYLSAGVGLQQQIRSSGQEAYNKGYSGKGGFGDHIPSLYLRLHKGEKWFLQSEFRFGVPQLVPGFSYSQQTRYDTANAKVDVTRLQLKKLYYHQLPLSINYSPLRNWSVGTGVVFSRFYRAVAEQQVESNNLATGTQTSMSNILRVPKFRDSFLYKTQVQFLVQTEYQLGRLALGLRYKRDAQSYIRYTKPDGTVSSEKGEALEAVLRFRLWQNKNRK